MLCYIMICCVELLCSVVLCCIVLYCIILSCVVLNSIMLYYTVLCCNVSCCFALYYILLFCVALHYVVLCCSTLCCIILRYATLCCAVLYCAVLFLFFFKKNYFILFYVMSLKAYTELGSIYVMAKRKSYVGSSVGGKSLWYEGFCMLLLLLVCAATWSIGWKIVFVIFGTLVVRRVLFLLRAILFLVFFVFFCIFAKYCFLIESCFEFLWVLRFFLHLRKNQMKNLLSIPRKRKTLKGCVVFIIFYCVML